MKKKEKINFLRNELHVCIVELIESLTEDATASRHEIILHANHVLRETTPKEV